MTSKTETGIMECGSHTPSPRRHQEPSTNIPSPKKQRRVHICRNDDPAACCFASSSKHGAHNILEGKRYSNTNGLHQDRTSSISSRGNDGSPVREGVIGEISSRGVRPILPVPDNSANYQVVRQYLHKILTKTEWGLAVNHRPAIRATLNNWFGTGWELRRRFQAYQMRDLCPAAAKVLKDGTAKIVHFAPEVRVWIVTCVVREMQLYFEQEMHGVMDRSKITSYGKASGKRASTPSSSRLGETLVAGCKNGEVQYVKPPKRSLTIRPVLPLEWLQQNRSSVVGGVRPVSDGVSASGSSRDKNLNDALRPGHSPTLRRARPLAHFYPSRTSGHSVPTSTSLNSQPSSKRRSPIWGSLSFSRGGLPSSQQSDDELRSVRFEETACEEPPVTDLVQPATLQPTQTRLNNIGGMRIDSSRPSDERIVNMRDTVEGASKVLPKKSSIGRKLGGVLRRIKMRTK